MHAGNGIRTRRLRLHITCAAPRPWSELCRLRVPVSGRWACTVLDRRCCVRVVSCEVPTRPVRAMHPALCMYVVSQRARDYSCRRSSEVARRAARMGALKMPLESVLHPSPGIPRTRPSIARVMLSPALYTLSTTWLDAVSLFLTACTCHVATSCSRRRHDPRALPVRAVLANVSDFHIACARRERERATRGRRLLGSLIMHGHGSSLAHRE